MRVRMLSIIIKLDTSMSIMTKSDILLIKCQFIEYNAPITVLYGTVDWRVGGAIGPLGNGVTSV